MDYPDCKTEVHLGGRNTDLMFLTFHARTLCTEELSVTQFSTSLPYFDVATPSSAFGKLCILAVLKWQIMQILETLWAFVLSGKKWE
jgi:hypothetical protein